MPPDEPTDEERQEELSEDNQTPFNPAAPPREPDAEADSDAQPIKDLDDTHPATDTDVQPEGLYESGTAGEVEASEPNAGNAVVDFDPDKAQADEGEGNS